MVVCKIAYRPVIEGRHNVPRTGPAILASNHLSFFDSVAIPVVAPRRVRFLAKVEYFTGRGVRGTLIRWWFRAIGSVPVERGTHRAAHASLDAGRAILDHGDVFGIYPEGSRSRDGRLYRGKTGVAWLALTTGVPVVPVGIVGTDRIQPVDQSWPRIGRFTLRFGEPMMFPGRTPSAKDRRVVTDEIMAAIHALSGQELAQGYNEPSG